MGYHRKGTNSRAIRVVLSMNYKKVFISYSGLDLEIVQRFDLSLKAIGIEPFLAERFVATGQNVPEKIAKHIRDSNAFVPFLTKKGLANQWVNQEIGYAYCWMESEEIDPPYFFPVVEEGQGQFTKGFLGIPVVEYIPLRSGDFSEAIYRLLFDLRRYIDRNWAVLEKLSITCPSCKRSFARDIPSQRDINEAIKGKEPLETDCKICNRRVAIDPYNLLAQGTTSGRRWESNSLL